MLKPTESELGILNVLWKRGPSTVREVNDILNTTRKVGYTNTLKMMQLMHEKGMLDRDESMRSHVYIPLLEAEHVKKDILDHMIDTLYDGSTSRMMIQALGKYASSPAEIEKIKELLENLENEGNHD